MLGWREKPGGRVDRHLEALPRQDRKPKSRIFDLSVANSPSHTKLREPFKMKGFTPYFVISFVFCFIFVILAEGWIWTQTE